MSVLLIGLVIISLTYLILVPVVRLWFASAEQIQKLEAGPTLAPYK